jgi:fluoride exporter
LKTIAAIAVAGAFGALARYGVGSLIGPHGQFPWSTLVINIAGSAILGLAIGLFVRTLAVPMWIQSGIVVGFLGAFTTFSTFSLDLVRLVDTGRYALASGYIASSVVGGVVALRLSMTLAR